MWASFALVRISLPHSNQSKGEVFSHRIQGLTFCKELMALA
jgi:hypothetical protein